MELAIKGFYFEACFFYQKESVCVYFNYGCYIPDLIKNAISVLYDCLPYVLVRRKNTHYRVLYYKEC